MRNILLLILLGAIAGCAPIKTKTTVFHAPDYVSKGTLMVVADDPNINSSLEFTSYKKKFENKLSQHGYTIVNDINNAEYKAIVAYGVSNGRTAISSDPIYDDFGRKVGSETSSTTRYTRIISMEIFKINNLQGTVEKVYESKTRSEGSCGIMNQVFEPMLNSMFKSFPGNNGKTKTAYDTVDISCHI